MLEFIGLAGTVEKKNELIA